MNPYINGNLMLLNFAGLQILVVIMLSVEWETLTHRLIPQTLHPSECGCKPNVEGGEINDTCSQKT